MNATFTEFEKAKVIVAFDKLLEKRRPLENIRDEVDVRYSIDGLSVTLVIERPFYGDPNDIIEEPIAKATYDKVAKTWTLYWHRADLKWHRYKPSLPTKHIDQICRVIDEDENGCFWG